FVFGFLMVDAQRAVTARKENQTSPWIESGIVDARADREAVDHLPSFPIHDDHLRLFAAADKQAVGIRIVREARGGGRDAEGKSLLHLQRFGIENYDFGSILTIYVN